LHFRNQTFLLVFNICVQLWLLTVTYEKLFFDGGNGLAN